MKKLMIAVAIVCAAAMAQAANVAWGHEGMILDGAGDYSDFISKGTLVYLMSAATDADTLVKGFTGAGYASTVSAASIGEGKVGTDGALSVPNGTTTLAGGLSGQQAYYVLFNGDNMFVSDTAAMDWISTGDGNYKIQFADPTEVSMAEPLDKSLGYQEAGSWYSAGAVPEPTSGLLLLLGVAGLALRRKRA